MDAKRVARVGTPICTSCEQKLNEAAHEIRHHATQVLEAINFARSGPSDEEREQNRAMISASFKQAQEAWIAYRDHLGEHGIDTSRQT
jgi:uncharacterized protein YecT (DUF1311 family)